MRLQSMQQKKLILIIMIVAIVFISTIGVKVIKILNESTMPAEDEIRVAIIASDGISDQSWGSLAYKGQLKIEEQFPVEVLLYSEKNTDELIEEAALMAIEEEAKVIMGHGREFSNVFTKLASVHKDVHFVTLRGTSDYPNQSVYTFEEETELEYFAALAASLKTKSNKIGIIDAFEASEGMSHFEKGVHHYKPEVMLYYKVVGSRDNGTKAVALAESFIQDGVDVIYTKGNAYNRYVIDLAKRHNVYVVGFLDDQSYLAENLVLTSVMNDISQIYVAIMRDYFSAEGLPQGEVVLTESDGVYKLAPFGPMFSENEMNFIQNEMDRYYKGEKQF